jgi:hypothetical protein
MKPFMPRAAIVALLCAAVRVDAAPQSPGADGLSALASYDCVGGRPQGFLLKYNALIRAFWTPSRYPEHTFDLFESFGETANSGDFLSSQHVVIRGDRYGLRQSANDSVPIFLGKLDPASSNEAAQNCASGRMIGGYGRFTIEPESPALKISARLLSSPSWDRCVYNSATGAYSTSARYSITVSDAGQKLAKSFDTTYGRSFASQSECKAWKLPFDPK